MLLPAARGLWLPRAPVPAATARGRRAGWTSEAFASACSGAPSKRPWCSATWGRSSNVNPSSHRRS